MARNNRKPWHHRNDKRKSLHAFIELLQHFYRDQPDFKV